jgi:hypothetical protein
MAIDNRLLLSNTDNYEAVTRYSVNAFHLIPPELCARFTRATKRLEESYMLFTSRLENLQTYYLRSRCAHKAASCGQRVKCLIC